MQNISNPAMIAEPSLIGRRFAVVTSEGERLFGLDTTFVLFFLAMDIGLAGFSSGLDVSISGMTLAAFLVVPYFLPFFGERDGFREWMIGRMVIGAAGLTIGLMLSQAIGVLLPESFKFGPMTLLIVSAIFSCYLQIYGIIRFRLAR